MHPILQYTAREFQLSEMSGRPHIGPCLELGHKVYDICEAYMFQQNPMFDIFYSLSFDEIYGFNRSVCHCAHIHSL